MNKVSVRFYRLTFSSMLREKSVRSFIYWLLIKAFRYKGFTHVSLVVFADAPMEFSLGWSGVMVQKPRGAMACPYCYSILLCAANYQHLLAYLQHKTEKKQKPVSLYALYRAYFYRDAESTCIKFVCAALPIGYSTEVRDVFFCPCLTPDKYRRTYH